MSTRREAGRAIDIVDRELVYIPLKKGATHGLRVIPVHAQGKWTLLGMMGAVQVQKFFFCGDSCDVLFAGRGADGGGSEFIEPGGERMPLDPRMAQLL